MCMYLNIYIRRLYIYIYYIYIYIYIIYRHNTHTLTHLYRYKYNTHILTHLFVDKTLQMLYVGTVLLARTGHLHAHVQI